MQEKNTILPVNIARWKTCTEERSSGRQQQAPESTAVGPSPHRVFAVHCQDRRTNSCLAPLLCLHSCMPLSCSPGLPSVVSVTVAGAACFRCCRTDGSPFFLLEVEVAESRCFDLVWVFTLQLLAAVVPLRRITLQSYPCS